MKYIRNHDFILQQARSCRLARLLHRSSPFCPCILDQSQHLLRPAGFRQQSQPAQLLVALRRGRRSSNTRTGHWFVVLRPRTDKSSRRLPKAHHTRGETLHGTTSEETCENLPSALRYLRHKIFSDFQSELEHSATQIQPGDLLQDKCSSRQTRFKALLTDLPSAADLCVLYETFISAVRGAGEPEVPKKGRA